MNAKETVYNFQMERFKIFQSQDYDSGEFDVVFEVAGKKLYANKYVLSPISTTFKAMLSKRWIQTESIKISEYTFEDFKEFLTFLYSGKCTLTTENISTLIDLAEFYDIFILKKICDDFISKIEITVDAVFHLLEISDKYSLTKLQTSGKIFLAKNFVKILESESFLHLSKMKVIEIVKIFESTVYNEEIFNAVYKWGKHQISKKQLSTTSSNINIYIDETLKKVVSNILSVNHFVSMKMNFLIKSVFTSCIIYGSEISEILSARRRNLYVTVINANGKKAEGYLQCDENEKLKIAIAIKALKDQSCRGATTTYWTTKLELPSTPSLLKQKDFIKWYLVLDRCGDVSIRNEVSIFDTDYLIAEMKEIDVGFVCTKDCKIEIHRDF